MIDKWFIGADIGGTFTDIIALGPGGRVVVRKVLSTPDDYGSAIRNCLSELLNAGVFASSALARFVHATTVATNAVLEGKGAKTALLVTEGFRDVIEIGRLRVPVLYDLQWEKPPALVPRSLRYEVRERVSTSGEILRPLDGSRLKATIRKMVHEGVESVVVSLLNSYNHPRHEQEVARIVAELMPSAALTISTDVSRELGEVERTSTAMINGYIKPLTSAYLSRLSEHLAQQGIRAPVYIMQSNGGMTSLDAAKLSPVHMLESGPAAGVVGAREFAIAQAHRRLMTFDMGGTTAKASVIEDGALSIANDYEVGGQVSATRRFIKGGGYLVRLPSVDVAEVGAGGGSVAWVDAGMSLRVGPHSAGANPGPACYGLGGSRATVTDANVVLGYLDPVRIGIGGINPDPELALRAVERDVSAKLHMSVIEAAFAIHTVANATMSRALRTVSTERGRDIRRYVLFAFGGSGPLHAAHLAKSLSIQTVLVPPAPGVFSAYGLLTSDIRHDYVRTCLAVLDERALPAINAHFAEMEKQALEVMDREGSSLEEIDWQRLADLRFLGQQFVLTIPLPQPNGAIDIDQLRAIREAFIREHEETYGHVARFNAVQLVALRLTSAVHVERPRPQWSFEQSNAPKSRLAYDHATRRMKEFPVMFRGDLSGRQAGPIIIEEYDSTTVVPSGFSAVLDEHGNVLMEPIEEKQPQ